MGDSYSNEWLHRAILKTYQLNQVNQRSGPAGSFVAEPATQRFFGDGVV
jgi:hypothetical protein